MRILLLITVITTFFLGCGNSLSFERDNPWDPKSDNFTVSVPDFPNLEYHISIDGIFEIHFPSKTYITGVTLEKKYSDQYEFETIFDEANGALLFADSSKFYTQGTEYRISFFNEDPEGNRLYNEEIRQFEIKFLPFRNFQFNYSKTGFSIRGELPLLTQNPQSLNYFDGVKVSYKETGSDSWTFLRSVKFREFAIAVTDRFTFIKNGVPISVPFDNFELKAEQFIVSSIGEEYILAAKPDSL